MLLNGLEISKIMKEKHISWDEAVVIWKDFNVNVNVNVQIKSQVHSNYIYIYDQKCETKCVQDSAS